MAVNKNFTVQKKITKKEERELILYLNNLLLFHLVKLNYRAFLAKAKGGIDDYGNNWTPLSTKVYNWKKRKKILYSGRVAINIRTRALLHALKPGHFRNGVYVPPPNQKVSVSPTTIKFSVQIQYADAVNAKRVIFLTSDDALVNDAVDIAMPLFQSYLRRKRLIK